MSDERTGVADPPKSLPAGISDVCLNCRVPIVSPNMLQCFLVILLMLAVP